MGIINSRTLRLFQDNLFTNLRTYSVITYLPDGIIYNSQTLRNVIFHILHEDLNNKISLPLKSSL